MGGWWSQESPLLHLCGSCSLEGVCRDRWWPGPRTELGRCHQAGSAPALVCLGPHPRSLLFWVSRRPFHMGLEA